jgi:hypothetical protein
MIEFAPALIKKATKLLKLTKKTLPSVRIQKFADLIPDDIALTDGRRLVGQELLSKVRKNNPDLDERPHSAKKHNIVPPSRWKKPDDIAKALGGYTQKDINIAAHVLVGMDKMMKDAEAKITETVGEVLKKDDFESLFRTFVLLPAPAKPSRKGGDKAENVIHL